MEKKQRIAKVLTDVAHLVGYPFMWMAWKAHPMPEPSGALLSLEVKPGGFTAEMEADGLGILAQGLARIFFEIGGENYVTLEMFSPDVGMLELTIRRISGGKTPAQVADTLRKALADAHVSCTCGATEPYAHLIEIKPFESVKGRD